MDRSFGREAFGANPENYHQARPAYPERVWDALIGSGILRKGIDILEIGAGTGLATAELLTCEPSRLVATEPDTRLADFLREHLRHPRLEVLTESFESAELQAESFDLIACATAFHWLDAASVLPRMRDLLRPHGAVALWWNVFGDHERPDPFHDATSHLFARRPQSPSAGDSGRPPYALDCERRLRELGDAGFLTDPPQIWPWTLTLDPHGVRNLYATFSDVSVLPPGERESLLDSLAAIAATQFGGRVDRNMTTALYTAFKDQSKRPVDRVAGMDARTM